MQRVSCKDPATLLFAVGVAGANVYNEGDNLGPPDYESVAKYSEPYCSEWFNELFYNLLCMICVSC